MSGLNYRDTRPKWRISWIPSYGGDERVVFVLRRNTSCLQSKRSLEQRPKKDQAELVKPAKAIALVVE